MQEAFASCIFLFHLHIQIAAQHLQAVQHAIDVAALIAVAGVHTCADEAVTDVVTASQGSLHIGAIEGINKIGRASCRERV